MAITRCFIDVETTGLIPSQNAIVQISGIIEQGDRSREFDLTCCPFPDDIIEPSALEANKRTESEIRAFQSPQTAHSELISIFNSFINKFDRNDKMFFIAYNAKFDEEFLRAWFKKCGDNYFGSYFWTPSICVMVLAGQYLIDSRPSMPNFKQITVAAQLDIDCEESLSHDALYDVRIAKQIYEKITISPKCMQMYRKRATKIYSFQS